MSDQDQTNESNLPSELETLQARADFLGIKYHPKISADNLAKKIQDHLDGKGQDNAHAPEDSKAVDGESFAQMVARKKQDANQLVRVFVSCRNPSKKEWDGEIITTGNSHIGTFKKFVKFDAEWHVPKIIYDVMKARRYQEFYSERTPHGEMKRGRQAREFSIEVLPPLTKEELAELAKVQRAAGSVSN